MNPLSAMIFNNGFNFINTFRSSKNALIILITGGAGFIGVNLTNYLVDTTDQDLHIIIVDNCITGSFENFDKRIFKRNVRVDFLNLDITDNKFLKIIKNKYTKIDQIYHLASLASPKYYKKYPLETINVGYIGTKNMLELTKYFKCKFLFSSTSEVYGDPDVSPQAENYFGNVNTVGSRSCYDESKRIAETLIYEYQKEFNLDTKIARIFNTYGPYMNLNDGRIITEIIKHYKSDTHLEIYGDGTQTRSFCYITDTIDQLYTLMNTQNIHYPINIGNDNEMSINKLIDIFNNITDKKLKVLYKPLSENDPKMRKPCLKLNNKILGMRKNTTEQNGLLKMLEFYEKSNVGGSAPPI
jgi:UDP-glucuronate decarboxylase